MKIRLNVQEMESPYLKQSAYRSRALQTCFTKPSNQEQTKFTALKHPAHKTKLTIQKLPKCMLQNSTGLPHTQNVGSFLILCFYPTSQREYFDMLIGLLACFMYTNSLSFSIFCRRLMVTYSLCAGETRLREPIRFVE